MKREFITKTELSDLLQMTKGCNSGDLDPVKKIKGCLWGLAAKALPKLEETGIQEYVNDKIHNASRLGAYEGLLDDDEAEFISNFSALARGYAHYATRKLKKSFEGIAVRPEIDTREYDILYGGYNYISSEFREPGYHRFIVDLDFRESIKIGEADLTDDFDRTAVEVGEKLREIGYFAINLMLKRGYDLLKSEKEIRFNKDQNDRLWHDFWINDEPRNRTIVGYIGKYLPFESTSFDSEFKIKPEDQVSLLEDIGKSADVLLNGIGFEKY